jgi:hypothetical protein
LRSPLRLKPKPAGDGLGGVELCKLRVNSSKLKSFVTTDRLFVTFIDKYDFYEVKVMNFMN